MFRRLLPLLTIFLAVILDTAVIPALYRGIWVVSVTLAVTLGVGLTLGRLRGMLYGMLGGLMIDVTVGTVGMMTFTYMAAGFLIALILDETNAQSRRPEVGRRLARRALTVLILTFVCEGVFCVYHYFLTASFTVRFLTEMLLRSALMALLTVLLTPVLRRLYLGKQLGSRAFAGKTREVKHF